MLIDRLVEIKLARKLPAFQIPFAENNDRTPKCSIVSDLKELAEIGHLSIEFLFGLVALIRMRIQAVGELVVQFSQRRYY